MKHRKRDLVGRRSGNAYGHAKKTHCRLAPIRTAKVRDEDGTPCTTTHEQHQHWRYFTSVLNICSQFSLEELGEVEQRPIRAYMDDLANNGRDAGNETGGVVAGQRLSLKSRCTEKASLHETSGSIRFLVPVYQH